MCFASQRYSSTDADACRPARNWRLFLWYECRLTLCVLACMHRWAACSRVPYLRYRNSTPYDRRSNSRTPRRPLIQLIASTILITRRSKVSLSWGMQRRGRGSRSTRRMRLSFPSSRFIPMNNSYFFSLPSSNCFLDQEDSLFVLQLLTLWLSLVFWEISRSPIDRIFQSFLVVYFRGVVLLLYEIFFSFRFGPLGRLGTRILPRSLCCLSWEQEIIRSIPNSNTHSRVPTFLV